eukprot:5127565-Alexandrium_andersonii.AAC.1
MLGPVHARTCASACRVLAPRTLRSQPTCTAAGFPSYGEACDPASAVRVRDSRSASTPPLPLASRMAASSTDEATAASLISPRCQRSRVVASSSAPFEPEFQE